ncbi:MAG: CRISPR-associated protein Cas6, partial [Pseudomonadota bacterium]
MLYGKYQFCCKLESEASLPFYKGSTFRGVFGRALKKVVCALKRQECAQCLLKQRCVYALVFETSDAIEVPEGSRIASPPHPFVIEPPLTTETRFPEGGPFDFNLLLFGEVNNNLPYFIYAFDQMGKIGIGKKINGKRGQFALNEVRHGK